MVEQFGGIEQEKELLAHLRKEQCPFHRNSLQCAGKHLCRISGLVSMWAMKPTTGTDLSILAGRVANR